jgi:hypothetical protein
MGMIINPYLPFPSASFADDKALYRTWATGAGNFAGVDDSNGMGVEWDEYDEFSISLWVKPGWSSSLNTNVHLFCMNDVGVTTSSGGLIRIYYHESNNRMYFDWRSNGSNRTSNFWLFHSTSSQYLAAYNAAGLGSSYWSNTNRGNVGDDDYTMITVTKGSDDQAKRTNVSLYWNAASCGNGYYTNGYNAGTPALNNNDRKLAFGSSSWNNYRAGNYSTTRYNDITFWDKRLSAAEVSELYNNGTRMDATTHSAASDLKGYYTFETAAATIGEDTNLPNGGSTIGNV